MKSYAAAAIWLHAAAGRPAARLTLPFSSASWYAVHPVRFSHCDLDELTISLIQDALGWTNAATETSLPRCQLHSLYGSNWTSLRWTIVPLWRTTQSTG